MARSRVAGRLPELDRAAVEAGDRPGVGRRDEDERDGREGQQDRPHDAMASNSLATSDGDTCCGQDWRIERSGAAMPCSCFHSSWCPTK